MRVLRTALPAVVLIEPLVHVDERGFFYESWNQRSFGEVGIAAEYVQDNHSRSERGVLRGLHYQVRRPQGKLVRVVSGEIFDVAVDLRPDSATFGLHAAFRLSAENKTMAWIPEGFAHGFLVLSEFADVLYKATDFYAPELERSLLWRDPDLAIDWPLDVDPLLSEKDMVAPLLRDVELPG